MIKRYRLDRDSIFDLCVDFKNQPERPTEIIQKETIEMTRTNQINRMNRNETKNKALAL